MIFENRRHAGQLLAERLSGRVLHDPLLLALPRGGVPVALELAKALGAPLEVLVVRKIGAPGREELGIGAIAEEGYHWIDHRLAAYVGASPAAIRSGLERERAEVDRRVRRYRQGRPLPAVRGRSVVVVDDGLATGVTARVACAYLRAQGASEVLLAVPVCSPESAGRIRAEVDELVCLGEPDPFHAVGQFYREFPQLSDDEVLALLREARRSPDPGVPEEVAIPAGRTVLGGTLTVPPLPRGIVLFAHGSGSSRLSPRNRRVAETLHAARFGTLLFDLLTPSEAEVRRNVFDIPFLAERLEAATHWVGRRRETSSLPLGYFGASTGGAAALWAAATPGLGVAAVVSRGGRPDLARARLHDVLAPTLLLVGERDEPTLGLNRAALRELRDGKLTVVPGATHLFEEPGALEIVEREATAWFLAHLGHGGARAIA